MTTGIKTTFKATHDVEITADSGLIPANLGLTGSWGKKAFQVTSLNLRWEDKGRGWQLDTAFVAGPVILASGKLSEKNTEIREFTKLLWDDSAPLVSDEERLTKSAPEWVRGLVAQFAPQGVSA